MRTFCSLFFASMLLLAATPTPAPPLKAPAVYRGHLPCADCTDIVVTLRLNANRTYFARYVYTGRSTSFVEHGTWTFNASTGVLMLQPFGGSAESWRAGSLTQVASAPENPPLQGTTWTLVTLEGAQVGVPAGHDAPSMTFDKDDSRVYGSGGCNHFTGAFTATTSGGLTLSQVASTRMFCIHDMETEDRFFSIFDKVRGYRISDGTLALVSEGGSTLATLVPNP